MKPLSLSISGRPLARHEDRAPRRPDVHPQIDYHFQAVAEKAATAREQCPKIGRADLRAFRMISSEFTDGKTHRGSIVEMAVFALIAGVVAWPLISLLIVLAQTANG